MNFATVFIVALFLKWALLWLLSWRQERSVQTALPTPEDGVFYATSGAAEQRKAADYTIAKQRLGRWSMSISVILTLMWTVGGGLSWLDSFMLALSGWVPGSLFHGLALIGVFALINGVLGLPLSIYSTFVVEERFGFNRTKPGLFIADLFKSTGFAIVLGGILVGVILWLMQSLQGTVWWLWAWCFIVAWNLALIIIYPRWLAPIFNRFTPLQDEQLLKRINNLLSRCGFDVESVHVMDGSKRSAHSNAYFTGLGKNKRVVFFDTLMEKLSPEQIEAVLAHELGHSALKHIPKRLIATILLWLPGLWLLDQLLYADWFFSAFGISVSNHMALLLFTLVLPAFTFFFQPLFNYSSRKHEFEADAYAAKHSDKDSLIAALLKIYQDNAVTLNPDPWYSFWHETHPPPMQRISRLQVSAIS